MNQALLKKTERPKNGRRFAIGDVHACLQTFKTLVWQQIQLQPEDQLFLLGDYIDRGPNGAGVLDFIMDLQQKGYQIYPLRGNHEQMLLTAWDSFQKLDTEAKTQKKFVDLIRDKSLADTQNNCLPPRFEQWLNNLPYYYELDNFYLAHAGFNFKKEAPFEDTHSMMWVMRFSAGRYNAQKAHNKYIVHGHRKTSLEEIKRAIENRAKVLPIDNGCYMNKLSEYGHLCAFNLDTWELIHQKNIDMTFTETDTWFQKVDKPANGRRFVIGDVHGCLQTLETLVWQRLKLLPKDQLFLLGDYIDRGPDSAGVLDFIIDLQNRGYQVFPLQGNHEQALLDTWRKFQQTNQVNKFAHWVQNAAFVDDAGGLPARFDQFLSKLPYYYELDNFYLVHAGFNFNKTNPFEDKKSMLRIRKFKDKYEAQKVKHKRIIHGHMKTSLSEIKEAITNRNQVLPLDNGCYAANLTEFGHLCALDIDTWELIYQQNLDMK